MVHGSSERLLDPRELRRLQEAGVLTPTFVRLDPARQDAVVSAILAEAFDRGPSRVRLKETAVAAGVSVGSLYQYFGNRAGVLAFAIEAVEHTLADDLGHYIPMLAALPLREALGAWVTGGMEWSSQRTAVMQFFARGAYEGDPLIGERLVAPVAAVMLGAVRAILTAARERGEVAADCDLDAAARAVHALLTALSDSQLLPYLNRYYAAGEPGEEFGRTLSAALDLIVVGLKP